MGVSGSGKSTLGIALARELGWDFLDADDFHSVENIARMSAGIPLTDADRAPWLPVLNRELVSSLEAGRHPVLACSALKARYRTRLLEGVNGVEVLYLRGNYQSICQRLQDREGHYMKENLLKSQFDALEEPAEPLVLEAGLSIPEMIETVFREYPSLGRQFP